LKEEGSFSAACYKNLDPLLRNAVSRHVFPGAAVGIAVHCGLRRRSFFACWGNAALVPQPRQLANTTLFDLASLTKPLATVLALLCLIQEKKITLDEPLASLLQREVPADKKNITLRHLLNHCSGFTAHRPFYLQLVPHVPQERKNILLDLIIADELAYPVGGRSLYSDLGFMVLGQVVEIQAGVPLDLYVREKVMAPLGLADTLVFNPAEKKKKDFAATELCPWRHKVLDGEVHDDNTWAVGGVSGQAGLFGDIDGVLSLVSFLLAAWQGKAEHPNFSRALLQEFLRRQEMVADSSWALGFDTPSPVGSSAGRYISPASVGHLGFTGTSFWIDPGRELVMVLLTNRVHPSRANNLIREFRPLFHERVMEMLINLQKT
jgi:CubicO group peptidase (beta-lactamase class C family)